MTALDTKISPMMAQWHQCKEKAKNAVLLFRLGDFYEAFYEDALICSETLDLTLTKRQEVPMSGVPVHTVEYYIDKLVSKGFKVAIAEQMEDAKQSKGLVKRDIIRVITPGTVVNSSLLSDKSNNYIAAIHQTGQRYGLAFLDLTCADCRVIEVDSLEDVLSELFRFRPSEIISSIKLKDKYPEFFTELKLSLKCLLEFIEEWRFDHQFTYGFLTQTLRVHTLDGFGLRGLTSAINAVGALLAYVKETLLHDLGPLQAIIPYSRESFMALDKTTIRNLDLIDSIQSQKHTLLNVLDDTKTPMGARLLKRWLMQPLLEIASITERQDSIAEFLKHKDILEHVRIHLNSIRDLERLVTKITIGSGSPKDFVALKQSLLPISKIKALLSSFTSSLIYSQKGLLNELIPLIVLIEKALVDDPPLRLSDGGVFRSGFNQELDELRSLASDSKSWMLEYQGKIREETQIKTLKVGYSQVAGFFIEVSKGQVDKMPPSFQRRQTLTNAERFITPELKKYEDKILHAEEKIKSIEATLFQELKQNISRYCQEILQNAASLAVIDAIGSLSFIANANNYVRPTLDESSHLNIIGGRHPVIEAACLNEKFVSNDTDLDGQSKRLMLITGPNMAGKSTYIRQVALIVIMAQMGSFVPATSARIGIIDKVFTRIGASDDLARGQSTFMVEMTETASILHNITSRSLVILDEIGRGTSTYDGISLAWSIAEYLLTIPEKSPKTLFATHYWELTKLEEKVPGAINFNVAVHESEDQILFLRKIVQGGTDKSYGIHVARLAGLPKPVLERAKEILVHLEENANQKSVFESQKLKRIPKPKVQLGEVQLDLF